MRGFLFLFAVSGLAAGTPPQAPPPIQAPSEVPQQSPEMFGFELPPGMVPYQRSRFTQSIAVVDGRDQILRVSRALLAAKWRSSGGMEGVTGWTSTVYRNEIASRPKVWVGNISVKNSFGYFQQNRGYKREYADGSVFMDVLSAKDGTVFEARRLEKVDGKWKPSTMYADATARPKGYAGLQVACASCHSGPDGPGTGGYGVGLVPGGDGIISAPFPALEGEEQEEVSVPIRTEQPRVIEEFQQFQPQPAMRGRFRGRACST